MTDISVKCRFVGIRTHLTKVVGKIGDKLQLLYSPPGLPLAYPRGIRCANITYFLF